MTSLLYGAVGNYPVPADENVVRMTTAPVTPDAPAAMADDAPVMQEVETDSNPLLGMATRQVASTWHSSEKYSPEWAEQATARHNEIVNEKVATSGTAAARELAGEFGHGTMAYAVGIEPVNGLTDGARFGNEYFATVAKDIQPTAGDYMTPIASDADTSARVSSAGKAASRDSSNAAAYRNMYEGFLNGL